MTIFIWSYKIIVVGNTHVSIDDALIPNNDIHFYPNPRNESGFARLMIIVVNICPLVSPSSPTLNQVQ